MLALKSTTTDSLKRVVNGLTGDLFLREDLMQEATIHFWRIELNRPGQTLSWYLQSCSFHLRHYLQSGRSVDSAKRRAHQMVWPEEEELCEVLFPSKHNLDSVRSLVEAREIIDLLQRSLTQRERCVLHYLDQGFGVRQIARSMKISHPVVLKCRRRIAFLAIRLGMNPTSARRNGFRSSTSNGAAIAQRSPIPAPPTNGHQRNGHRQNVKNGNGHRNPLRLVIQPGTNGHAKNGYGNGDGNGHKLRVNGKKSANESTISRTKNHELRGSGR